MKREKLYLSTVDPCAQNLAKQYGLGLEIAEYCTAWNLDREFDATDAAVRKKLSCTDRAVLHGPFNELFPCAIDPEARILAARRFRQTIRTAQGYGIHKIILHGGYNNWLYFPCWYLEESVVFWRNFAEEIPEDVEICLENVLEEEPEMLAGIIRQTACPRLRMCLDVGHAHAYAKQDVFKWVEECADVLDHFHLHNNDGSRDSHSPLDWGTIPMEALLEKIETLCPAATKTLELSDAASSVTWLMQSGILEE